LRVKIEGQTRRDIVEPEVTVKLIEIANALSNEAGSDVEPHLRRFRRYYRHLAASVAVGGQPTLSPGIQKELAASDKALDEAK